MHYLITGGCGFIGSHLAKRLIADGHQVTILDDLSTGKKENAPNSARLVIGDITQPGIFDTVLEGIDGCFHLAAIVSVQKSLEDWLRCHQVNLCGMVALLDALRRRGQKIPVVFASSAAAYGNNTAVPLQEHAACTPISAYGVDKLACEWHAHIAATLHAIPTVGLRFFNVYGPNQDASSPYSGVISIFASRIAQRQPVTVYGDGNQSRDFIFVGDVVNAMLASMQKMETRQLHHGIFNVCTGMETTINDLLSLIVGITGVPVEVRRVARRAADKAVAPPLYRLRRLMSLPVPTPITHVEARPGDIRVSLGDPSLARQLLGFTARTPLADGLEQTLKALI